MNPKEIAVAPPATTAENVKQAIVRVGERDKRKALRALLAKEDIRSALIFCNRKKDVDILQRSLLRHKFSAASLHGDMSQPKRMETLEAFRRGDVQLLVCSDVAARGLDITDISHVVNFDVPTHAEDYVHRIGRTGRAGRSGDAFTLVTPGERRELGAIVNLIGSSIPEITLEGMTMAEAEPVAEKRRSRAKAAGGEDGRRRPGQRSQSGRKGNRASAKGKAESTEAASDGEETSKPFGKHTPAFLLRPVKIAAGG